MTENNYEALLTLWFSERAEKHWFNSTPEFDLELKERFENLHLAAKFADHLEPSSVEEALALVILLDQIPLNIYRGQKESFETEGRAREVAEKAIEQGWDDALNNPQRMFLYLPYMHSEDLNDQERSVSLFESAGMHENVRYANHHRKIVARFGRFPHRNKVLGRESTAQEIEYLNSEEAFLG